MPIKRIITALFFVLAIDAMNFGIVLPMLSSLFLDPLNGLFISNVSQVARIEWMGIVLGAYPFAVCIGTPLLGMVSDRFGRKPTLLLSLAGTFVGLIASGMAVLKQDIVLFLIARLITGVSSASQPIAQAAVADFTDKQRPVYFSIVAFAMTVGMVVGPLLGGFFSNQQLFSWGSLSAPFFIAGLLALGNVFLTAILYKETFIKDKIFEDKIIKYVKNCLGHLRQKQIVMYIILFFFLEFVWSLFFQSSSLFLVNRYHYSSQLQSLYITFLGLVMCFGLACVFRPLAKYFSLKQIIIISLAMNVLGLAFTVFAVSPLAYWLASIPLTLGVGLCYTALISELSLSIGKEEQGWLMGFAAALLALAWTASGFLSPKLLSLFLTLPYILSAVVSGLMLILYGMYLSLSKRRN